MRTLRMKAKRLKILNMNLAHAKTMVRTAGTPAISYGWDVFGVSDSALRVSRSLIASMLSASGGGKCPDAVLMAADSAGGSTVPVPTQVRELWEYRPHHSQMSKGCS